MFIEIFHKDIIGQVDKYREFTTASFISAKLFVNMLKHIYTLQYYAQL